MNKIQINMDPENSNELPKVGEGWRTITNHRYNLRPQPTKQNKKYIMTQEGQQSANKKVAKPHTHIMMMRMSVKQGIKRLLSSTLVERGFKLNEYDK